MLWAVWFCPLFIVGLGGHIVTDSVPDGVEPSVPSSARIWNYWLGGKDNFSVDRQAGSAYAEVFPHVVNLARESRAYLGRVVRFLAGEAGVRQFLDVGTGLPTENNTHEVAQSVAPECRIVYVDHDPIVLVYARALLIGTSEGSTRYLDADMRDPQTILKGARQLLDFSQPIALIFNGVLGHVAGIDEAHSIVTSILGALASGSYLSINDGIRDDDPTLDHAQAGYNQSGAIPYNLRTAEEIATLFDGLELVEPGLVRSTDWRPDPTDRIHYGKGQVSCLGRKP
jgi:hypothetical protein